MRSGLPIHRTLNKPQPSPNHTEPQSFTPQTLNVMVPPNSKFVALCRPQQAPSFCSPHRPPSPTSGRHPRSRLRITDAFRPTQVTFKHQCRAPHIMYPCSCPVTVCGPTDPHTPALARPQSLKAPSPRQLAPITHPRGPGTRLPKPARRPTQLPRSRPATCDPKARITQSPQSSATHPKNPRFRPSLAASLGRTAVLRARSGTPTNADAAPHT